MCNWRQADGGGHFRTAGISDDCKNQKRDNQQAGSQAVKAVAQVNGIGGAGNDDHGKRNVKPAEIQCQIAKPGKGQLKAPGFGGGLRNDPDGGQRGGKLEKKFHFGGHGVGGLFGNFDIVVGKTGQTINQQNQNAYPNEGIVQIGKKQHAGNGGSQYEQASHGWCAFFGQQVALRSVFADRLSFSLMTVQKANQLFAAGKAQKQSGKESKNASERQ